MIKKIKSIYKSQYMNRPLVYKCYSKVLFSLVLGMAWYRFVNDGVHPINFMFSVLGLVFICLAWFNYLKLDGVTIGHLMMGWQKKKPNTVHWNKDIADFVDEEVIDFDELADDEKDVIKLLSNLIVGLLYFAVAIVCTFIGK